MRTDIQSLGVLPANTRAVNSLALALATPLGGKLRAFVPGGRYQFDSGIVSHLCDIDITADPDAIFDIAGPYGTIGWTISGELAPMPSLSAANRTEWTLSLASAPSLSSEDVFMLHDPTPYRWLGHRPLYQKGEYCTVRDLSGSQVRLIRPLYDSYVPADTDVYKLISPRVSIKGLRFEGSGLTGAVRLSLCDHPVVEHVTGFGAIYQLVEFDRCHMFEANALRLHNLGTVAMFGLALAKDDYGLCITNCQGGRVNEGSYYGRRHAIAIGGDSNIGAIINRNCIVSKSVLSNDPDSDVFAADMHGNMEWCGYEDSTLLGGAGAAGRNNHYRGNTISSQKNGSCIYAGEVGGGSFTFRDNHFISTADPSQGSRGILDFGGNSNAISEFINDMLSIQVANNTVRADKATAGTSFMSLVNRSANCNIDISITDLMAVGDMPAMGAILRTRNDGPCAAGGGAFSRRIVVDNVPGFPASTMLHNAVDAPFGYSAVPQRLVR